MKQLYPRLSDLIEKIPKKLGTILTWVFLVFMIYNIGLSALALNRYTMRQTGNGIETFADGFLDEHFPDERMERIYPNAILVE